MKNKQNIVIMIIFLVGLSLVLYPVIGNIANTIKNNREIALYTKEIATVEDASVYDDMFAMASMLNDLLPGVPTTFDEDDPIYEYYETALSLAGGMMGYLLIDKIDVKLSIYHGTDDGVLQNSVGYLEGTHLPTGEVGNSTVLTGHTGLPTADLLTDLDQLEIGDTFQVVILNRTFTYEVFEINVVLPYEVDSVSPREDINMVTLVTCTPYGVNSHRLLVHGELTANPIVVYNVDGEQYEFEWNIISIIPVIALPMIIILLITLFVSYRRDKKNRKDNLELEEPEAKPENQEKE